jgi:hypothetical protein
MGDIRSGLRLGLGATGQGVVGAWLMSFYLFSFWMVLGTLSSQKLQEQIRMERMRTSASAAGVSEVLEYRERVLGIADRLRSGESVPADAFPDPAPLERIRSGQISVAVVRDLLVLRRRLDDAEADLAEGEERVWSLLEQRTRANLAIGSAGEREDDLEERLASRLDGAGFSPAPDALRHPPAPLREALDADSESAGLHRAWREAAAERERREEEFERLTRELEMVKTWNLENRRRREQWQSRENDLLSRHPNLKDYLNDAVFLRMMGLQFLATMPDSMLTLILTLCMGGLGSVIYLTRFFFDAPERRAPGWYMFRTLLGMGTAVAVFILVKAGQFVISDQAAPEGAGGSLNPFFISFLAIVSGLLSEQAYARIERSGIAFFRVEDGQSRERWAFGVRRAMEGRSDKTAEALALGLDMEPGTVADWLSERRPVPPDAQRAMALWLGRDIRDLFSDQPPPDAKKEPPPEGEGVRNERRE